jgi:ribonuclease P/MRP protein subunit POP7
MASQPTPFNVSSELAKLKHEKQNGKMYRLPANATIQRRPINHAPVASPSAGSQVQKVVYVSTKTPFMSAVKRVRKLLQQIEKRVTQDVKLIDRGEKAGMQKLAESQEKLVKDGEAVYVKASGKAMAQALRVGEWFRSKETEMSCKIEVKTGSVSVVDDIVELDEESEDEGGDAAQTHQEENSTILEGGDTTMDLLGNATKSTAEPSSVLYPDKENTQPSGESAKPRNRRRKRKKRPMYDADDLPEQRLRWIKTVEVAISFKA